MSRTIFITGTDTGVGKTVLTASLVHYLRSRGANALGMKPFCSGGRDDVRLLQSVQLGELSDDEVNPFFYKEAVAPLVAQRKKKGPKATLEQAVQKIRAVARRCDVLIVEGSGGLLVPLGEKFTVAGLIAALKCEIVIVARNRLGTINHTLLTVAAAGQLERPMKVVLMDCGDRDDSTDRNSAILRECLAPLPVLECPFLGQKPASMKAFARNQKIFEKVLARVLE
jgi:dethiobiotin synthetase